jgi:hypothetical protein
VPEDTEPDAPPQMEVPDGVSAVPIERRQQKWAGQRHLPGMHTSRRPVLALAFALLPVAATATLVAQPPTPTVLTIPTTGGPSARYGHAMCEFLGDVLVFGGHDGTQALNDTWRYQTASNSWLFIPTFGAPSPRRWSRMVNYNGQVVLFGGESAIGLANAECWTFTGAAWVQVTGGPPARSAHTMVVDSNRQRVVMFGGFNRSDTWEYFNFTWTQVLPASPPPALGLASLVFDSRRNVALLHGGLRAGGIYENRCWDWNGVSWLLRPEVTPVGLAGAAATFDTSRQRVVLFGGLTGTGVATTSIHEHDGTTWYQRTPSFSPTARYGGGALFFESLGAATFVFGGANGGGGVYNESLRYRISPTAAYFSTSPGCGAPTVATIGTARPWLGSTFVRQAFIPAPTWCVWIVGFTQANVDLTSAGLTGCVLGSSSEILDLRFTPGGLFSFPLVLPNDPGLQGFAFFDQLAMLQSGANPAGIVLSNTMQAFLAGK